MAPGRLWWFRERAGLWLAGNDITENQSERLSQSHSLSPKLWELDMGIQKIMEQSLLLHLAHFQSREGWALCRSHAVLGTGGEGASVTLVEICWDGASEVACLTTVSKLASRGIQEPGFQIRF